MEDRLLGADAVDFKTLKLLETLLRTQSLSRSAAELDLSKAAASKMLARARRFFEDELFIRTGGGMIATAFMAAREARILSAIAAMEALSETERPFDPKDARDRIRVAATDNGSAVFLGAALPQFLEKAPHLQFSVTELNAELLDDLREGRIDLAIEGDNQLKLPPAFRSRTLCRSRHVVMVRSGHPLVRLAAERALTSEDFRTFKRILLTMNKPSGGGVKPIFEWSDADDRQCAAVIPYALSAVMLIRRTDCFVSVPFEMAKALMEELPSCSGSRDARGGFAMLEDPDARGSRWEPKLIWHERTEKDPLLEWVRSVLLSSEPS